MTDVQLIAMEYSDQINELAEALAQFQEQVPAIPREAQVKYKGVCFKYADLPTILSKIRKPLAKAGLSFLQGTESHGGRLYLSTMLMHKGGQWIRSRLPLAGNFQEMKGLGAAVTYGRRYALSSILGIASDDDIDDEPAIRQEQDKKPRLNAQQVKWAAEAIGNNKDLMKVVLDNYGCTSLTEIPASCWTELHGHLTKLQSANNED